MKYLKAFIFYRLIHENIVNAIMFIFVVVAVIVAVVVAVVVITIIANVIDVVY